MNELINKIISSNQEFVSSVTVDSFKDYQESQSPFITLVTCCDSRVQVEVVNKIAFNKVFVVRNIGNQVLSNEGSVDYGVTHLKTPLLLILGHTDCGAVKAFMKGYSNEAEPIIRELSRLAPAISQGGGGLLPNIIQNINYQVQVAVNKYGSMIKSGELTVAGALYDFRNELKKGYGKLSLISINGEEQPF
ncbi:MAG: carbonic anhydrase [Chlorobi bacterium]|nr:carbonic anhydrase [Chlorobiota bacterium]